MTRRLPTRHVFLFLQHCLLAGFLTVSSAALAGPVGATWINPMNFGNFANGPAGGTLSMDVSTGIRTGTGSVVPLPGGSLTQLRVNLTGDPGLSVTITAPASIAITGTNFGSVMTWTPSFDTPLIFNMPAGGTKIINMAGDLTVPPGTVADVFSGSITIVFEYTF
jgi:hypothetical protein